VFQNHKVLNMKKVILAVSMLAASGLVFAAQPGSVQGPGYQATDGGVNIQGNTNISAGANDTTSIATGGSVAKSSIGAIRGGTNIMGNTGISAYARDTTAIATEGSKAVNSIGVIGGE
jgi:hypothetical protein